MRPPGEGEVLSLGRVLVVDDEVDLMTVLCETLSERGYDVVGCSSGPEALGVLKEQDVDVLLTDLMMPEMDGIRLLQAAQELDPHLVGIIMTGQGTVSTAVEAMKTGAFDYLLKPFKLDVLLPVVSRAMSVRRLRTENVRLQETVAIYELSKTVSFVLDATTILEKLADAALEQCQADEVSVMLPTREGKELYIAAVRGEHREHILGQRVPIDQGIAGWVALHGETLTLRGAVRDERFAPVAPREELQHAISMPMLVGGKLTGVLNVNSKQRRPFTLGQVKGLSILATAAAGALEHTRLYNEARRAEQRYRFQAERLAAVGDFARTISGTLELSALFELALQRVSELTGCAWCNIVEYVPTEKVFRIVAMRPPPSGEAVVTPGTPIAQADSTTSGAVLRTRAPYVEQDTRRVPRSTTRGEGLLRIGIRSRIAVPIIIGDTLWGTAGVGFPERGGATPERVEFLEAIAAHLAVAIQNAQLYSEALAAHGEITALNESLERRVEERTRELEAANELIARERATLSATMASMTDGLVVMNPAGEIAYSNLRASELLGAQLPAGQTIEQALASLGESLAGAETVRAQWLRALTSPPQSSSFELTTAGPHRRDVLALPFAVTDPMGQSRGLGVLLRDVSAEREVERMKDEIVAVVSHELRTPLASLVGFADLLLTREYDEERRRQFLTVMRQEGQRLTALINDFLDLQRLESGRATVAPTAIELSVLVQRAVGTATLDQEHPIRVDLPPDLPPVQADPDAIHQVLSNLLSNAIRYSPEGGGISVVAQPFRDAMRVSVIDRGLGIPREALARIFDKFYRVDNSDRREITGTGLGLAICRQIIGGHGGQIWAESEGLGLGAQIHFTLPLAEQPRGLGDVLIVEDDPGFARLAAEELAAVGISSSVAPSAEAALAHMAVAAPKAIVLDLILPDRQGESFLAELANGNRPGVPIVVVTVKDLGDQQQAELRRLGARAVLLKGPRAASAAASAVAEALAEQSARSKEDLA